MTNYDTVRNILTPLLGKYITVECVTDEKTGKWTVFTGFVTALGGPSGTTGNIVLRAMDTTSSGSLPISGILSIRYKEELLWKAEETAPEHCRCSGIFLVYGTWPHI